MNENKNLIDQETNARKGRHLTYGKRCKIETRLGDGYSIRAIAEEIDCSPSTISREIKNHTQTIKSLMNDCLNKSNCQRKNVCGGSSCPKKCKTCNKCKKFCDDYIQSFCETLTEKGLCNGCKKMNRCSFEKRVYRANEAENEYREMLVGRRNGFDLTGEQIRSINELASPLIKQGLSPFHIKQALGDQLPISESTLRRMIKGCELDARAIDLREAVKRKPRRKRKTTLQPPSKAGRLYEDYLAYIEANDVSVVEMDCVEGVKTDTKAILSLHFVSLHMQLYYILPEHTAKCVVETLDLIEDAIGSKLFSSLFEVILTDNGHEFWDYDGMECSIKDGKRTRIFYCEPNRSDEKGSCENNHKLLRYIIPKGTSVDRFTQEDLIVATNHVNSYCRKSLFGKSPYQQAMECIPEDFFIYLGLELIPPEDVILNPSLLRK
ncbi:MAG: IS30 family transposase [Lachnospiraceae bacterium]|nr:IS30 family transposase [Lachnospiraceae bacterium]